MKKKKEGTFQFFEEFLRDEIRSTQVNNDTNLNKSNHVTR